MAQRTTVVLVDDLDGTEADETVGFGLDGVSYEIDLAAAHAGALRDELAPYVAHARRLGRAARVGARPAAAPDSAPARGTGRTVGGGTARVDREQNRAIRQWAVRHGHPLSDRGRIPAAVADAFHRGDPSALPHPSSESDAAPDAADTATPPAAALPPEPAAPAANEPAKLGPDGLTSEERERIRSWAVEEGIEVKSRGRLTKDLIANYRAVQARR